MSSRMAEEDLGVKPVRLQKFIADSGVTSRRKAEELILDGLVRVNEEVVTELGTKVLPGVDMVMVKGQIIDTLGIDHVYVILNKPRGCVTTVSDPEGRETVMDHLKAIRQRVYPIGRLDYLSEGLLLCTNDGDLANKIMHPRFEIVKTYEVKVFGKVTGGLLAKLQKGMMAEDGLLKPQSVRIVEQLPNKTWLEFRLAEGKNREIRRLCEAFGLTIDKLRRVAIGGLSIRGIQPGEWRFITKTQLLKAVGINKDGSKLSTQFAYISPKKTVDVKKTAYFQKSAKTADDVAHTRYRKDVYNETLQVQKLAKLKREEEEKKAIEERVLYVPSYEKKNYNKNAKRR